MDQRIKKVLDYLEGHLDQSPRLQDLAKLACLSPSQFHRVFKKATGRTPFQFLEALKMNKSRQLLLTEQISIQELSDQFGYRDYETFSRAFKKHFHLSPDDLKAIAKAILRKHSTDSSELIIATFPQAVPHSAITATIQSLIKIHNLSVEELEEAQIFTIKPKSNPLSDTVPLIKNKFELHLVPKIWESLLTENRNDESAPS